LRLQKSKQSLLKTNPSKGWVLFAAGLLFAMLWPSASAATKIGLQVAQPFVICITRFFIAGVTMLLITHIVLGKRLPTRQEWKQLAIYGLLNITLYLGLFVLAMQQVSAGLGSLATATNPVIISLMAALFFRQKLRFITILSLLICAAGVLLAAYPLLKNSFATPVGMLLLLLCMIIYSAGVLYFSNQSWNDLHILTINGWQTILGGLFLLPVALLTYHPQQNHWNGQLMAAVLWLAIPVSVVAVQLWLYLLKDNAVKASFWLFLCPVFGYIIANILMKEAIGFYTIAGMALVIAGVYLVQRKSASQ
jgi:probable blue pigment (indigoidine) exporter